MTLMKFSDGQMADLAQTFEMCLYSFQQYGTKDPWLFEEYQNAWGRFFAALIQRTNHCWRVNRRAAYHVIEGNRIRRPDGSEWVRPTPEGIPS